MLTCDMSMSATKRLPAEARRRSILDAALSVLAESGYAGWSAPHLPSLPGVVQQVSAGVPNYQPGAVGGYRCQDSGTAGGALRRLPPVPPGLDRTGAASGFFAPRHSRGGGRLAHDSFRSGFLDDAGDARGWEGLNSC